MDVVMADGASDKRFAPSFRHDLYPCGFLVAPCLVQVGELADVVDLQSCGGAAQLAASSDEPSDQLVAAGGEQVGRTIHEHRLLPPFQRDTTEPRDQWLPAAATFHSGLKDRSGSFSG